VDVGVGRFDVAAGGIDAGALVAQLLVGRGDGSWTGASGIVSAAVASAIAAGESRTIGWVANGDGSMTVAATVPGDTNLDGVMDILDVSQFAAAGMVDAGPGAIWSDGDFNYDGVVDILDVSEFLVGGPLGQADGGVQVASVPEPSVPVVPVLAAVLLTITAVRSSACRVPPAKSTTAR
jgi:hypothetical protein